MLLWLEEIFLTLHDPRISVQKFLYTVILLLFCYLSKGQATIFAGNDTTICYGTSATLQATVTSGSYGTSSYTFEIITYSPEPYSGGTAIDPDFLTCGSGTGHDDCWAGPYNIGFSFCFMNQVYTKFWVGSNGWIGFSNPAGHSWTTYTAEFIPCTADACPKNCIFAPWEDWWPTEEGTNNVFYYLEGTEPNRKLVVYWLNCPMYGCTGGPLLHPHGTFQIVINEQSSIIENHLTEKPICQNNTATQGVQDSTGTVAFTATGRNNTVWSTSNESTRFVPDGLTWYAGSYPGGTIVGYGSPLTITPSVTGAYFAVVQTCDGSIAVDSVVVYVVNPQFNYSKLNYCQNEPNPTPVVQLPGGVFSSSSGLVFLSASTGQINLSVSTPGPYTVTYTPVNTEPCIATNPVTINISPSPPGGVTSVQRCSQGTVTFTATIAEPGDSINWYDLPSGGTELAANTLIFTTPVLTTTTTFYAETQNSGCLSPTRTAFTAIIKPKPIVTNNPPDTAICSGQITSINLLSSVPGSIFSWIIKTGNCSANILTCPDPGSGGVISNTLSLTNYTQGSVIYSIIPNSSGCLGDTANYTVLVNPLPASAGTITGPNNICQLAAMVIYNTPPITNATQYIWSVVPPGAGTFTGTTPTTSMTWANGFSGSATIFVKGNNSCGNGIISAGYPVTVNPTPLVTNNPPDSSMCTGQTTAIVLHSNVPLTTFIWLVKPGNCSPNILVCPGPGAGNVITNTLTLSNTNQGTVIYSIIPTAATCTGDTFSYTLTVKPVPGVAGAISGLNPVCQASKSIIYSVNPISAASQYIWSVVPAAAGTLTGTTQNVSMNWANNFTGTGTLHVQGQNACGIGTISPGDPVTVYPNPVVSFSICGDTITTFDAKPFKLRGGIPLGGNFSGPGVTGGIFDPASAGTGIKSILYTYTNTYTCLASGTRNLTVLNAPVFACGNDFTDVRDNKVYGTVKIGSQCWISENLNFGTNILLSVPQRDNCIFEKYCLNDNPANCSPFGGLYQWDELMNYDQSQSIKGVCPPGWHIPSETEWQTLFNQFNSNGFAGSFLKATGFSGFNVLTAGIGSHETIWNFINFATFFWSSTAEGPDQAWAHGLNAIVPSVSFYPSSRANSFYLRCLHD